MFATNYRPFGDAVFRMSSDHFWVAFLVGILVTLMVGTFCLLMGVTVHHYRRAHLGPKPASWWVWVIVVLNVVGVAAYYLLVIEPEQKRMSMRQRGGEG